MNKFQRLEDTIVKENVNSELPARLFISSLQKVNVFPLNDLIPISDGKHYHSVLDFKCVRLLVNREMNAPLSLLEVQLQTGRKHQIRTQLSNFGHPIVGDTVYGFMGPKLALDRLCSTLQVNMSK